MIHRRRKQRFRCRNQPINPSPNRDSLSFLIHQSPKLHFTRSTGIGTAVFISAYDASARKRRFSLRRP
ncbi:hypothetical protein L6452_04834 [Arctium lappa]|uniref:Uncharacterized protein n=1 Tax=Arctium lappa TaxID=4217 RepID=A0ACB9EF32_ARCLA|nr:hypothetical protein L6452_04834 [Arctium lappa]